MGPLAHGALSNLTWTEKGFTLLSAGVPSCALCWLQRDSAIPAGHKEQTKEPRAPTALPPFPTCGQASQPLRVNKDGEEASWLPLPQTLPGTIQKPGKSHEVMYK